MKLVTLSPQLGAFLTKAMQMPDIEAALRKMCSEYMNLKIRDLNERVRRFEQKWGATFEEFSERCEKGDLDKDIYSYEVEKDFWEWERVYTLKKHYEALRTQWM